MDELTVIIKTVLAELWKNKAELSITADTPLLSSGLIDSFHIVDLLLTLESKYSRKIDPADIGVDNFDTIRQIHQYLALK